MARYEGMDDILRHVQESLVEPAPGPESLRVPPPTLYSPVPDETYNLAVDGLMVLLRDTESLREVLLPGGMQAFSKSEHDELVSLLGKVLHNLWACETALQRVAPYE